MSHLISSLKSIFSGSYFTVLVTNSKFGLHLRKTEGKVIGNRLRNPTIDVKYKAVDGQIRKSDSRGKHLLAKNITFDYWGSGI